MRSAGSPEAERSDAKIRDEARNWLLRLLDDPTAAQRARFEAWLHEDPAHREAYADAEATWHAAEMPGQRLAEKEKDALAVYLAAMDRNRKSKKLSRALSVLSLVLALALGGGIWLERPGMLEDLRADYVSARGERRTISLPDGTSVLLDADSALDEAFGPTERRIRVLRGAAFFEVAPSASPFVVEAANAQVRDIGTGFEVRLLDDGGAVTLEHGSVAVSAGSAPRSVVLEPGEQVHFSDRGLDPVRAVELTDALAWREGRFVFYRMRLGDVLRTIERYRAGRIVIASAALADQRVTGSFPLADPDAALASLQASVGFRANTVAGRLTVLRP